MTATDARPGAPAPAAGGPPPGRRTDAVTAALSVWFTAGLLLDAWAHNNVPGLESFFTPWHAVFYSGFAMTAGWLAWSARRQLMAAVRSRGPLRARLAAVPGPYRAALLAAAGFAVAGAGDLTWHLVFGIEQGITILFSPTHLALAVTMFVIVTTPLRTAHADPALGMRPGLRRLLPALTGLTLGTVLVLLFAQYGNALVRSAGALVAALAYTDRLYTAWVLTSTALTTLVLVAPLLHVASRWRVPAGTVTLVVAACGSLSAAVSGGQAGSSLVVLLGAAVGCDVLVGLLRPGPDRPWAVLATGGLVPFVLWSAVTAWAVLGPGVDPALLEPELVYGLPAVQGLAGLLAAVLATSGRVPPAWSPGSGAVRVAPGGEQVRDD